MKAVFRGLKYYPTGFLGVSRGPSIQPLFTDEEVAVLAGPVSRGLEKLGPDERLRFLLARTSWKPLFLGNKGISGVIFFDAPDRMNLAFDLLDESLPEDSVNPRAMVFADDPITIAGGDPVIVPPAGASLHPPAEDGATYPRWVVLDPAQVQVASEAPTPRPAPAAAPGPSPAAPPTPPPAVDEDAEALKRKLKNLDDLRRDGTISAEEYEKARQEILLQRGR